MSQMCVYTAVTGEYVHYIPLFLYQTHKAYPKYDVIVDVLDNHWYCGNRADNQHVYNWIQAKIPDGKTTAAIRFIDINDRLVNYEYALITDVDIMHMAEKVPIVEQHLENIGDKCYDNYFGGNKDRCPGVHFVSRGWWTLTADARERHKKELLELGAPTKDYDEKMLLSIIRESKLQEPSKRCDFWTHGIHLGTYRNWKKPQPVNSFQSLWISSMLEDSDFMEIVKEQSKKSPTIEKVFNMLKRIIEGK